MPKEPVNPASLFKSVDHGFSQGVVAAGRRTLSVSGQTAWDSMDDVVAVRIYVVGYRPEMAGAVGGAFREAFPGPAKPASTWIGVTSLADPAFLVEVEATAVLD